MIAAVIHKITPPIPQLAEDYLDDLEKRITGSENTLRAYTHVVNDFSKFIMETFGVSMTIVQIDHPHICAYLFALYDLGLSKVTAACALSAIRSWFKWMARAGYLKYNAAEFVSRPRLPDHLPRIPSVKQMNCMVDSVNEMNSYWVPRDKAMMELLYGCGLFNLELTGLNIEDINWEAQSLSVCGRGGKKRNVPMGDVTAEALRLYVAERRAWLQFLGWDDPDTGALFVNHKPQGSAEKGARLTTPSVGRIVKRIAIASGLSPDINPRTLRDAFGTHMINEGAKPEAVAMLMGLKSGKALKRLRRLSTAKLKLVMDKTHPRAFLGLSGEPTQ